MAGNIEMINMLSFRTDDEREALRPGMFRHPNSVGFGVRWLVEFDWLGGGRGDGWEGRNGKETKNVKQC